ncbi:hypothetical protein V2O64_08375 [Verrucomicrobiaceae bacterium 227]
MSEASSPSGQSAFPRTRWTVVRRMADDRKVVRLEGWREFADVYWKVLVDWLERQGVSSPNAEDLVQGFIEKLWKSEGFASRLDPEGGKLRSFLLTSLKNWQREQIAYDHRQKRGGSDEHLELDETHGYQPERDEHYDRAWARATLTQACRLLREEYQQRDSARLFDEGLALLDDRDAQKFEAACKVLKMKANSLNVALKRLRERLSVRIRREVEATLVEPTAGQVNDEIRHLLASFGKIGSFSEIVATLSLDH